MELYRRRDFLRAAVSTWAVCAPAQAQTSPSPGTTPGSPAFTLRFQTSRYGPSAQISVRTSSDNWQGDLFGRYRDGGWIFELPVERFSQGMEFKFVLDRHHWMSGQNLFLTPEDGRDYAYDHKRVKFPTIVDEIRVEDVYVQRRYFPPSRDEERVFDVVVVGSGMGGGVVADQLADLGLDVLVLEAGGYLFPTHAGNLPRRHRVGTVNKNIWNLWGDFRLRNYTNAPGSQYVGAQAFNLGGRSIFWGALAPRMTAWELEAWPGEIQHYLETVGYGAAQRLLKVSPVTSDYQERIKASLAQSFPESRTTDAPLAIEHSSPERRTVPGGVFSTADLLMESRLTSHDTGNRRLAVNLNHLVTMIETSAGRVTAVTAHDLLEDRVRTFKGKAVVLSCGALESVKLAKLSGLTDPSNIAGVGITCHPIFGTLFAIPSSSPVYRGQAAAKVLIQHRQADRASHPYNVVLELGADLNEGRFVDPDILEAHMTAKGDHMLCEIGFLFNADLDDDNEVTQKGSFYEKPLVKMRPSAAADRYLGEIGDVKDKVIESLGGRPLVRNETTLRRAGVGAAAHEVGTLRMRVQRHGRQRDGVVDADLKFVNYENLYACDLSVFPTSPAANPGLTLVALALRLADHLKSKLG